MKPQPQPSGAAGPFARAAAPRYVLRLYVSGMTTRSTAALATVKTLCEEQLQGCYELEVVDIYQHPERAAEAQIVAVPTLVRHLPEPLRRIIGDLSNQERLLMGLEMRPLQ